MGLEKEVMHVVIKLPFKRPVDFVEPPPVNDRRNLPASYLTHLCLFLGGMDRRNGTATMEVYESEAY
jgi:hypothetical protein